MAYAKVKNDQVVKYPYGFLELQEDNPFTNFNGNGDVAYWFPLTETAIKGGYTLVQVADESIPNYDYQTQTCVKESVPKLVNGTWTLGWTVTNFTAEEQANYTNQKLASKKAEAASKLSATDWTQVADVPLLNKQEFTDYRAAVRAIALNPIVDAVFPQLPTEQWS